MSRVTCACLALSLAAPAAQAADPCASDLQNFQTQIAQRELQIQTDFSGIAKTLNIDLNQYNSDDATNKAITSLTMSGLSIAIGMAGGGVLGAVSANALYSFRSGVSSALTAVTIGLAAGANETYNEQGLLQGISVPQANGPLTEDISDNVLGKLNTDFKGIEAAYQTGRTQINSDYMQSLDTLQKTQSSYTVTSSVLTFLKDSTGIETPSQAKQMISYMQSNASWGSKLWADTKNAFEHDPGTAVVPASVGLVSDIVNKNHWANQEAQVKLATNALMSQLELFKQEYDELETLRTEAQEKQTNLGQYPTLRKQIADVQCLTPSIASNTQKTRSGPSPAAALPDDETPGQSASRPAAAAQP